MVSNRHFLKLTFHMNKHLKNKGKKHIYNTLSVFKETILNALRTFTRNFSNIDFFLKILPLKDHELATSEM